MEIVDYLENKISYLALIVAATIGFFFYWICVIFLYSFGFPFWLREKIREHRCESKNS